MFPFIIILFCHGCSNTIKTDNDAAYISKTFKSFCKECQIKLITGIHYNPQEQALVEHIYRTLKTQSQKSERDYASN